MSEWKQGEKHSDTHKIIFKNVSEWDRLRRVLIARCKLCDAVVSKDEKSVKELVFDCKDPRCYCKVSKYTTKVHQVCSVCYDMWHALYHNDGMKNMNYFKELDEKEAANNGSDRRRMGLDGN
jgi:hypothetical protein